MKRGDNFKGPGIGSVVGVEDVGSDSGKPMMPMDMLIKSSHEIAAKKAKNGPTASRVSVTETQNQRKASTAIFHDHKQKPVAVQAVGAKMNIRQNGRDMMKNSHNNGGQEMKYKPGTIIGSKSFVDWSGQTKAINGKPMAVGGGNFVFGNKQTTH
ncbi:hypothetical protein WR25_07462 [Diploscapter pachys]|uniref:Uncharacterized protein n=1 Tax=Diploscapter pachys TaxID=2018661 RepID=A0A2A2JTD2_9BILA|nr:hypothetical protein WR25_07462 [Diploscapter pachys]